MRAERALIAVVVLCGAAVLGQPAAAADHRTQARNQPEASRPAAARQAATRQPVTRTASAATNNRATATRATASRQATARSASRQAAIPARAAIPPQAQAQAALMTPVAYRAFAASPGTPILPVAASSGLSCVPFARMATGMTISGDARHWWHNAAATYARGQTPERGAVLAFMASGGMSRGHVGVVSQVVNARTIRMDHANWAGPGIRRGQVMRGVTVVDVSDRNDWTSVRVQVGHDNDTFGRTYPTHGFIYNRPAGGARMMTARIAGRTEVAEAGSPHIALHRRLAESLAE
jgi:surface antigen